MRTNALTTDPPLICLEAPEGAHILRGYYEEEVPGSEAFRLIRTCCGPRAEQASAA